MAWDSSRPVDWQKLIRSWLMYVLIMAGVFLILYREQPLLGIFAGLLVSGPLYLGFGYVLAKFGYQRKSWSDLRAERGERDAERSSTKAAHAATGPRPKPAPTSRTGGGSSRPGGKRKRR